MTFVGAEKAAHLSQALLQFLKYINYFLLFFPCFLLSWEITELRVCLLIMRPEYIGIICGHQLINSRIKGKELAGGDACQTGTGSSPSLEQGKTSGGRRVQLLCVPTAIKLNCLTLLSSPLPQKARV